VMNGQTECIELVQVCLARTQGERGGDRQNKIRQERKLVTLLFVPHRLREITRFRHPTSCSMLAHGL
jgi:hypothetical protein